MDRDVLAFRLGALEPPDQLRVEERLRTDPLAQASLLQPVAPEPTPDPWRLPPQGRWITSRTLQAEVFRASLRPGDRFEVVFTAPDTDRFVVVLFRSDRWRVVFPTSPDGRLPVERLPRDGDGYRLELSAAAQAGRQDWAVALPTEAQLAGGWSGLQAHLASGEVPVTRFHVEVATVG